MILGIFYHSAIIYSSTPIWLVHNPLTNSIYDYFVYILHLFRMHGFYIIAGFFAAMLIEKKGAKFFLRERLIRLGLPLVTIGFSLNFLMNQWRSEPINVYGLGYILHGDWLGHLWFLGNLVIYVLVVSLIVLRFKEKLHNFYAKSTHFFSKYFYFKFFLFCLMFYFLGNIAVHNSFDQMLFISTSSLFRYFPFFLIGFLFFHEKNLLERILDFKQLKWHFLIVLVILVVMSNKFIYGLEDKQIKFLAKVCGIYFSIVLSFLALYFFKSITIFNKDNKRIRSFSEASYSIYLLHQPIIVGLYHFFGTYLSNPLAGFVVISLTTLSMTYFMHTMLIDRFYVLRLLLNGNSRK